MKKIIILSVMMFLGSAQICLSAQGSNSDELRKCVVSDPAYLVVLQSAMDSHQTLLEGNMSEDSIKLFEASEEGREALKRQIRRACQH